MMLNIPVIKEWIEALRSGKYKQGKGALRPDEDCRCCLGVLCELSNKGHWVQLPCGLDPRYKYVIPEKGSGVVSLPGNVELWAGLEPTTTGALAEMNDYGKTFTEIADVLELWIKQQEKAGTV